MIQERQGTFDLQFVRSSSSNLNCFQSTTRIYSFKVLKACLPTQARWGVRLYNNKTGGPYFERPRKLKPARGVPKAPHKTVHENARNAEKSFKECLPLYANMRTLFTNCHASSSCVCKEVNHLLECGIRRRRQGVPS